MLKSARSKNAQNPALGECKTLALKWSYSYRDIRSGVSTAPITRSAAVEAARAGHYRWYICGLLFFATTINYIDRQVIGVLAPELQNVIGWNELQYGWIITTFQA